MEKQQLIRWLATEFQRMTGRRYRIDFALLDVQSLRELQRMLRDIATETEIEKNRARMMPWRR